MNPFADYLYRKLRELSVLLDGPVPSFTLAIETNCAQRTARLYAARLEAAGLVQRRGVKGGWLPAPPRPSFEMPPKLLKGGMVQLSLWGA